jgi:hypothetical protein
MVAPSSLLGPKVISMPVLHPGQVAVHNHPARFKVVICGRRWGKSRWGVTECIADALVGGRSWWVAPTYKIANEGWTMIRQLVKQIPGSVINKTDRTATLPGGGTVESRSADNPDALVGAGLSLAVLDEAADMQPEVWGESIRPALADRRGRAVFITTPKGHSNWTFTDLWARVDKDPVNWARWSMPTWTNPYIAADEIESMRADMSALRFAQEVGAEFVSMEGQVFPDFSRTRHIVAAPYDLRLGPVSVGVDFGYRTCAWVAVQVDTGGTIRVFADGELHNISTADAAGRLAGMPWATGIALVGCDPAGDSVNLQSGIGDVQVLRGSFSQARVTYSMLPQHRSPEWRAAKIRDLLWSAAGTRRLVVDPSCTATIRALEGSVYPKLRLGSGEKQEPVKDGVVDHARDALGYLLVNLLHKPAPVSSIRRPF